MEKLKARLNGTSEARQTKAWRFVYTSFFFAYAGSKYTSFAVFFVLVWNLSLGMRNEVFFLLTFASGFRSENSLPRSSLAHIYEERSPPWGMLTLGIAIGSFLLQVLDSAFTTT